jgi:hypothetical protein
MMPRSIQRILIALLLCSPYSFWQPTLAHAAQPRCGGYLEDTSKIVIDCQPGYATPHDRIFVYLRTPVVAQTAWQDALNYEDALWIYDVGSTNRAGLIIDYRRSQDQVIAELYDDQNGDGVLRYGLRNGRLLYDEPINVPVVRVTAQGGWWLPDGTPNFNLDISVDGSVRAMIEAFYLPLLKADGKTDYTIHVRDPNRNGRPNYEWRQAYPPLDENDGFYHSSVMATTRDDEPPLPEPTLFWPLLGSGMTNIIKGYGESAAPININWQTKQIEVISEFVASRGNPHNYFVYSIRRIEPGVLNQVNFESPFAFYQLGGPNPAYPDLSVRVAHWPKRDLARGSTIQQVDLTWRHNDSSAWDTPNWDYRLSLLGRNEHRGNVTFPEFDLAITPYSQLPGWATQNDWEYGSFVSRESGEYLTTEHIYEWSVLEGVVTDINAPVESPRYAVAESIQALPDYVRGKYIGDIGRFYQQIRPGLRGEFSPQINAQPYLYLSPIDHKLHLAKASHGVWSIAEGTELRYANLRGSEYLDQWRYTEVITGAQTITTTRELNLADTHLIYSDDQQVVLREVAVTPGTLRTLPPTTSAEWRTLTDQLTAQRSDLAPGDLLAMLRQFAGPELQIVGATAHGYRPLPAGGFRFILELKPGYRVLGEDRFGITGLPAGSYAVQYDGMPTVVPATAPVLSAQLADQQLQQLQKASLPITLHNDGQQDIALATLELVATAPDGVVTTVQTRTVSLLAQTPLTTTLEWAAPTAGEWQILPQLRQPTGEVTSFTPARITVLAQPPVTALDVVHVSLPDARIPLIAGILLVAAALGALAAWQQPKSVIPSEVPHE